MRALGSLIMRQADATKLPAGSALAVDRDLFAGGVTRALSEHPNVSVVRERIDALPSAGPVIVATGQLTAEGLAASIGAATGKDSLAFFDALAPIVYRQPIDMDVPWLACRWAPGGPLAARQDDLTSPLGTK